MLFVVDCWVVVFCLLHDCIAGYGTTVDVLMECFAMYGIVVALLRCSIVDYVVTLLLLLVVVLAICCSTRWIYIVVRC